MISGRAAAERNVHDAINAKLNGGHEMSMWMSIEYENVRCVYRSWWARIPRGGGEREAPMAVGKQVANIVCG